MKIIYFLFLVSLVFISCNRHKKTSSSEVTIIGQINGVPNGKIYLVESRKWKTPIDSTIITNGKFSFKTTINSPFLAAIHYWDSSKVIRLIYRNHTLGIDSLKYATDAFYIEPGSVSITDDNSKPPFLRIVAGKENELLFKNQFVDFGWIGNIDSSKRTEKIKDIKKTIQENSFSFFLLESIYRSKEQYAKSELTNIFYLFNEDVKQSKEGEAFKKYLSIRPDDNAPLPNLSLLTPNNTTQSLFDSTSKIHMLVFWASWCLPCRKEIPLLKELAIKYKEPGLKMVSVSIDENKEAWLKAISFEKMSWLQVHVPLEKIDVVQNQFRFTTIPLIIFTNNKGKEIKRFADYNPNGVSAYDSLIKSYLQY